jgi:Hydrazine synthase alpha subunit middle domain
MLLRAIVIGLLSLGAASLLQSEWSARAAAEPPFSFLYTAASNYLPLAWMHAAERFPSRATIMIHDSRGERALVPHFAASADPAVSFDGQRVLFAGKVKPDDPWQIWEMPLEGGQPERVISASEDCIRPFYLPENRIVYARRVAGRFVIEAADRSAGTRLALSYVPASTVPTDILRDGRVLFEAGFPLGTDKVPELYTVYSDGSGVESYRCDHGAARYSGKQIASADVVFATQHGVAKFTSALAHQVSLSVPAGEYAGEIEEGALGDWLLSWRHSPNEFFQLMDWTPGSPMLRPVLNKQPFNVLQPAPVRERIAPNRHPSGLHDWPNANLLCLNAYTSKYQLIAGSIHSVRLYMRDADGQTKLLGTAPVEIDGSFFVHVPTERPLQIELIDKSGKTLKRESGFFWMRRGEQRACVGCHAGPETAPENAVPMILLKSTTPADMTGATAHAPSGGN